LGDDLHDRGHIGDGRRIGDAHEEGRGDGDVAQLGQATADVLDIVVNAEDLGGDDDGGELAARLGPGEIGRQGEIRRREADRLDDQAGLVGMDRFGLGAAAA
jgi:hypothetical protein